MAVPTRGTAAYVKAYRIAFTTLAAIYLVYTLVAAATSLPPNYYHILGVSRDADEHALKAAFRKFARRNHPDRPEIGAAGAERFREVRDAYEMLKNPVKRFAYERFGPDIIAWKDCTTAKEYIRRGLSASSGFPVGTAVVLGLMSVIGQSSSSAFVSGLRITHVLFLIMRHRSGDMCSSETFFSPNSTWSSHQLLLCQHPTQSLISTPSRSYRGFFRTNKSSFSIKPLSHSQYVFRS